MIALWMAYSALITACAGAVAAALEPIARSHRLAQRWIWAAAVALAVGVPLAVAVRPRPALELAFHATAGADGAGTALPAATLPPAAPLLDGLLLAAWALGSLLCVATLALGMWQLRVARRGSLRTLLEGEVVALTVDLGPGATPYGSPRILVPGWDNALDAPSLRLLLTHEREHVRAGDPALLLCGVGALALMPWNPALWWCVRRLRAAIEMDCDARVLRREGDVRQYGELLLDVAGRRSQPPLAALLTFADSATPLERRITAMTESRRPLTRARLLTLSAVAAAAVVVACEARRPAPLAPVTDFVIEEGVTRPRTQSGPMQPAGPSRSRFALDDAIAQYFPGLLAKGGTDAPLMFVLDSANQVIEAKILPADSKGAPLPSSGADLSPDMIESVEVVKGRAMLPAGVRGGVILVTLKGAPRTDQELRSAQQGEIRQLLRSRSVPADASLGSDDVHLKRAAPGVHSAPLVEVFASNGTLIFSKHVARAAGGTSMGDIPVDPDAIEMVDVIKSPEKQGAESATIRIRLKVGAGLKKVP